MRGAVEHFQLFAVKSIGKVQDQNVKALILGSTAKQRQKRGLND